MHASTLAHRPRALEALAACSMAQSVACLGALLSCSDSCGSFGDQAEGVCVCVCGSAVNIGICVWAAEQFESNQGSLRPCAWKARKESHIV